MKRILPLAFTFVLGMSPAYGLHDPGRSDQEIQVAARKALHAYSLTAIQSSVQNATVTLTGLVNHCWDRLIAVRMMRRIHGVKTVDDRIQVIGPRVPDDDLQARANRIIADRIRRLGGFGFGSITARAHDGEFTLSGTAAVQLAEPVIATIANIPGVRNVVDHVGRVAPYDTNWASNHPGFIPTQ